MTGKLAPPIPVLLHRPLSSQSLPNLHSSAIAQTTLISVAPYPPFLCYCTDHSHLSLSLPSNPLLLHRPLSPQSLPTLHSSTIAQTTLISVKICFSFSEVYCFHALCKEAALWSNMKCCGDDKLCGCKRTLLCYRICGPTKWYVYVCVYLCMYIWPFVSIKFVVCMLYVYFGRSNREVITACSDSLKVLFPFHNNYKNRH